MKVASVKSVSMRRQPEGEGIALETSQDFPNTERETSLELANLVVGNHALYQLSYSRMPFSFYRARDFRPAEVAGRLTAMTVDAPDVAFRDLGGHACPPLACDHPADLGQLFLAVSVIELENDW